MDTLWGELIYRLTVGMEAILAIISIIIITVGVSWLRLEPSSPHAVIALLTGIEGALTAFVGLATTVIIHKFSLSPPHL